MTISVLLPSRGRPDSLRASIASLRDHAADRSTLEILVATDPDDPHTLDVAAVLGATVWTAPERYGYAQLHLYFNRLADLASGSWLLLWNDDAIMTTTGWNERIAEVPDEVMVADLQSQLSPSFCCFPAVRRRAIVATGGVYSPHTPHVDSWWQDIGRQSGTIRPVDVHVRHDRFDLTGAHHDPTYLEGRAGPGLRDSEYFSAEVQAHVAAAADRLRALR